MMRVKQIWLLVGLFALLLLTTVTYAGVDILNFTATQEEGNVRLSWQTSNEATHSTFNLWRSDENLPIVNGQIDLDRVNRVNPSPIISPNPCGASGQSYSYLDQSVPESAETVYYYLESFDGCSSTNRTFIGDGSGGWRVDMQRMITLFLPALSRPQ